MLKYALWVRLEAKPGKEKAVADFLNSGLQLAMQETRTPVWFALKLWFVLRHYGIEGLQHHVRQHVALAQEFAGWVQRDGRFELVGIEQRVISCGLSLVRTQRLEVIAGGRVRRAERQKQSEHPRRKTVSSSHLYDPREKEFSRASKGFRPHFASGGSQSTRYAESFQPTAGWR